MEPSELGSTTSFPKRGSRICNYCGCSSGNRAYACKSCHRPFQQKDVQTPEKGTKRTSCDVSDLLPHDVPMPKKLYSVRTRDRGPDYRTLVSVSEDGFWKCNYDACKTVQESRMRSTTCSDVQRKAFSGECEHVRKVQKESLLQPPSVCHPLHVNTSILQSLPFPPSVKEELQAMKGEFSTGLIQRVSEETFLVRDLKRTQEHQYGVLHMRFLKPKLQRAGDLPAPPTFHCPCATFRRFSSLTSHSGGGTTPRLSKRCIHFYVCLWAFASNENLAREFSHYLSPEHAGNKIIIY